MRQNEITTEGFSFSDDFKKLNAIIIVKDEDELENDIQIKYLLRTLFLDDKTDSPKINFGDIKCSSKEEFFSQSFIFFLKLFSLEKNERKAFYQKQIKDLINTNFLEIIKKLFFLQRLDIQTDKTNYNDLYMKILEKYFQIANRSIIEYIDVLIFSISYVLKNEKILNYTVFSLIYCEHIYTYDTEKNINFKDSQINFNNDNCLKMMDDLFSNKEKDDNYLNLLAVIIIRFETIKEVIEGCDYSLIRDSIIKFKDKIINTKTKLPIEKIIILFCCEIEEASYNNDKSNETIISNIDNISNKRKKSEKEPLKNDYSENNTQNEIILNLGDNNEFSDDYINEIYEKLNKMEKFEKSDLEEIKKLMKYLIDDNKIIKDKLKRNEEELANMKKANEEKLANMKNDFDKKINDIKVVVNNIQVRNLSKNFLFNFYPYLTEDDKFNIYINSKLKGKIISERLKKKFPKHTDNKKFKLILKLIDRSANSLNKGNFSAHSIEYDYYKEKIESFKKRRKIGVMDYTDIFCFLVGINVDTISFDEAYDFLINRFNTSLRNNIIKKGIIEQIIQ